MLSEKIVSLVFDGRYREAASILRAERNSLSKGTSPRVEALPEILQKKVEQLGGNDASMRRLLAGLHMLGSTLMEQKYWADAEIVLCELVSLSLAKADPFFLDDARLSRAVCLKALGRLDEFKSAKAEIPKGTRILMNGEFWQIEDI